MKTLLCPRRAGKSYAAAVYLLSYALQHPNASLAFVTMTKGTAKRILWHTVKRFNDELELGFTFHNVEMRATAPSKAMISLHGSETQSDIDKLRGVAYDVVLLDECKSFPQEIIDEVIDEVLRPALYDRMGTLAMLGTPGAILAGSFYKATGGESTNVMLDKQGRRRSVSRPYADRDLERWQGVAYTWSSHSWHTRDNVAMPQIWQGVLADKAAEGWSDENPIWLREYMGQWLADDGAFVYRFKEDRNLWTPGKPTDGNPWGLPEGHEWEFVMGLDLGYDDPFAMQVFAHADTSEEMLHVYEFRQAGMTITDIARKIAEVDAMFGGCAMKVGDRAGLGKQIFASLDEIYGIHIEPADKQDKRDYIELLNADLVEGRVKYLAGTHIVAEMKVNQWDESGRKEDEAFPNDAVDSGLYLWRWCYHHFARQRIAPPDPGSKEWALQMEEDSIRRLLERRAQAARMDPYDDGRPLDPVEDEGRWRWDA